MAEVLRDASFLSVWEGARASSPPQVPVARRNFGPPPDVVTLCQAFARWADENGLPTNWVGNEIGRRRLRLRFRREREKGWRFTRGESRPEPEPDRDLQRGIPWSSWSSSGWTVVAELFVLTDGSVRYSGEAARFSYADLKHDMARLITNWQRGKTA